MARRLKAPPAGLFTNGEELPLFTGAAPRVKEQTFDPQPQPRQLSLGEAILPRHTFEELATLKQQGRIK
jgi:hypothetical protein